MPYIEKGLRLEAHTEIDDTRVAIWIASLESKDAAGFINYLNFKIVKTYCERHSKYFVFCWWVGTMLLCIFEVARRIIWPYEDKKIEENGDV